MTHTDFYDEYGFLIIEGMFDKDACSIMKFHAEQVHKEDYAVYLNIHRDVQFFYEIASSNHLVDVVKSVQKSEVVITNDQYLYKKEGTPYAKQAWTPHQDSTYTNAPYGTYMQLHIMLDDQSKENGGLYFYPGSHKEPMLPYTYAKSWKEDFDEDGISHPGWKVEVPEKYEKADVNAKAGTVFLQHGNLIHGSYPNLSNRSRAQYSIAYLNKGTVINKGEASIKIPIDVR